MALNFPASPELNEIYKANNVVYIWDGAKWTSKGDSSGISPLLPDENGNITITGNLTVEGANISGNAAVLSGDLSAANADLSNNLSVAGDIDND
jgi:hypothetical protein